MTEAVRTSIPRIRAVRFKAGGEVRVMPSAVEAEARKAQATLADAHRTYSTVYAKDLAGYAMVVWDHKGRHSVSYCTALSSPYGRSQLPVFLAETVRLAAAGQDAGDIVKRMLGVPTDDGA